MIKQTQFAILVFCNVYFRLHYYFPLHRFVKRKTRIRAIGPDAGRPNIGGAPVVITVPKHTGESPWFLAARVPGTPPPRKPPLTMATIKVKRIYS